MERIYITVTENASVLFKDTTMHIINPSNLKMLGLVENNDWS